MLWCEYNYDEDIAAQRQKAFDDGVSKGIEQGSHQAKIDTAKNALLMKLSVEQVIKLTGLTKAEMEQLAKETQPATTC